MSIKGPDDVLGELGPLIPVLWEAMERATQHAQKYFMDRDRAVDPCLAPNLVRYDAKLYFDEHELETEDEPWDRQGIANNGLELHWRGYRIRILKSDHGCLPTTGDSLAKLCFFHQLSLIGEKNDDELNLVLLWDTDREFNLSEMSLVCPKSGGNTRDQIESHWQVPLPHAVLEGDYFDPDSGPVETGDVAGYSTRHDEGAQDAEDDREDQRDPD